MKLDISIFLHNIFSPSTIFMFGKTTRGLALPLLLIPKLFQLQKTLRRANNYLDGIRKPWQNRAQVDHCRTGKRQGST